MASEISPGNERLEELMTFLKTGEETPLSEFQENKDQHKKLLTLIDRQTKYFRDVTNFFKKRNLLQKILNIKPAVKILLVRVLNNSEASDIAGYGLAKMTPAEFENLQTVAEYNSRSESVLGLGIASVALKAIKSRLNGAMPKDLVKSNGAVSKLNGSPIVTISDRILGFEPVDVSGTLEKEIAAYKKTHSKNKSIYKDGYAAGPFIENNKHLKR